MIRIVGVLVLIALLGGGAFLYWSYRQAVTQADAAWGAIAVRAVVTGESFDPRIIEGLPEVARRYFTHAIAPGTPLHHIVELSMRGTFLLGDKQHYQQYGMEARQMLSPTLEFVWIPSMRSGPMHISGSDALVAGEAWTRFWINSLVPVVNVTSSPDLVRSAMFRSVVEGIWAPAALLPRDGIVWEQAGPNVARLTVSADPQPIVVELTIRSDGSVQQIVGQRWSNANPRKDSDCSPSAGRWRQRARSMGTPSPFG